VRRLSKKVGDVSMGMVGLGVLAVGMMAAPAVQSLAWLVVMLVVASLGRGLAQPGMQAVASKSAKPGEAGLVMGAFQASASLGRVFGPALGGFIYRLHPPALFWSAGAILAVCLGAWWSQRRAFVR
jgi:MFS family permease